MFDYLNWLPGVRQLRRALESRRAPYVETGTTLVIVDMQPADFETSKKQATVDAVSQLIVLAMQKQWSIVVLEWRGSGLTDRRLRDLYSDYPKLAVEVKSDDDGSWWVQRACMHNRFGYKRFVVCGVNIEACVLKTVKSLALLYPRSKIVVPRSACNGYSKNWSKYDDAGKNVEVVPYVDE